MDRQLAARILRKGKNLAPDRFPALPRDQAAAREMLDDWTGSLAVVNLPEQVWSDAVTLWATHLVSDRMVTPKDLVQAAYLVRDRWENDPTKRELLDAHRRARLNANYTRMGLEPLTSELPAQPAAELPTSPQVHRNPGQYIASHQAFRMP